MTRKLLALFLPFILAIVFVPLVNAQNSTTASAQTLDAASKLKQQMVLLQEQKNAAITKAKEEARVIMQAKRDEFKVKLQTIKDQKRKALIEKIDAKLTQVNANQTAKFSEVLVRLQGFLDKIKQSVTDTKILANIVAAQTAIDTAKAAVDAQAAKIYTIEIVDDTTLKLNAGTTVSQLRVDLMNIYKLVVDAKQAVQKLNIDRLEIKPATSSAEL